MRLIIGINFYFFLKGLLGLIGINWDHEFGHGLMKSNVGLLE